MTKTLPKTLNGYPVIDSKQREDGSYTVLVFRDTYTFDKYVVATWFSTLESGWSWGHYFETLDEANKYFNGKLGRG